jgi:hypothetical protein
MAVPDKRLLEYDLRKALAYQKKIGRQLTQGELESFRKLPYPKELIYLGAGKITFKDIKATL